MGGATRRIPRSDQVQAENKKTDKGMDPLKGSEAKKTRTREGWETVVPLFSILEGEMRTTKWMCAGALGALMVAGSYMVAYGQGKGKGKGHDQHGDDDQGEYYKGHDREEARGWYNDHESNLPPGLAKKDRLPPGLEKQLARNGTLPPGLQKRIQPCPPELVRVLPPPPPDCAHVQVAGHIVLLNRKTNVVLDILHFH